MGSKGMMKTNPIRYRDTQQVLLKILRRFSLVTIPGGTPNIEQSVNP